MAELQDFQQRPWVWLRESLQNVPCAISIYWKNVLKDIEWVLRFIEENSDIQILRYFRNGPFGHFLDYVGGNSNNAAIHTLLTREVIIEGASECDCWFRVGGTNIRFSPVEFDLVTGLRFGGTIFDPYAPHDNADSDIFYNRILGGEPTKIGDLLQIFLDFDIGLRVEDYVKIANVLVLYTMLIGYDHSHVIDSWVWTLVEDEDMLKAFPWGSYCYEVLMHYMMATPRSYSTLKSKKKKSYHFYGPVWALQVWAFEALPELGKPCGTVSSPEAVPRCLRWTFPKKAVSFRNLFTREDVECYEVL